MSKYNTFALFYDILTENADYKVRNSYISNFFSEYKGKGKKVLDLACGTGTNAEFLSRDGYSVTGIDLSYEMLTQAKNKCPDIEFIRADMTDFTLPDKYDYCICTLDAVNHLASIDDVSKCFKCVYNSLADGGLFIFDANTVYKHKFVLADNSFVFDEEDFFLSWDNSYSGNGVVEIFLDFFIFNGKSYDRYSENFTEKAYPVDEMKNVLKLNGFDIIHIYDDLTENPPNDKSERIYFVCKKVT